MTPYMTDKKITAVQKYERLKKNTSFTDRSYPDDRSYPILR